MACAGGGFVRRASALLNSAIRSNLRPASTSRPAASTLPSKSTSSSPRSFSVIRLRQELGCLQSLLPLHSMVATARMTSCLSTTSRSCQALSQDGVDGT